MDVWRPQDEYFEWDDIIAYKGPTGDCDGSKAPSISGCRAIFGRSFCLDGSSDSVGDDFEWSEISSLSTTPSSPSSTDSLSTYCLSLKERKTDAELDFPSYDDATSCHSCVTLDEDAALALTAPPSPILEPVCDAMISDDLPEESIPLSRTESREAIHIGARDDLALNIQPFRNVNYLTHDWCEEDIPGTWRYVVSKRAEWTETSTNSKSIWKPLNHHIPRCENALWRSWAQRRYQLKSVSPDVINWMKSCDETTLYGPFMMSANELAPSTTVTADCARTSKLRSKNARKPLLKRPAMSEILLRGSIPTFVCSRHYNGETHQTTFQAKPSYDPSLASPGMSTAQRHELTSVARIKLGLLRPKKSVRFLDEVEQCEIVKYRVNSKSRRTLRKLSPTTLGKEAYVLPSPVPVAAAPVVASKTVDSHWSPESLWSYNPDQSSPSSSDSDNSWTGIIGEDDDSSLYPAPIRIHKQQQTLPQLPPRSKHFAAHNARIGNGSLERHLNDLKYEEVADDELDYLIAIASPQGSLSPPTSESSSNSSGASEETLSDEEELPFFGTGDITEERRIRTGKGEMGMGIRIVGEMDDEEMRKGRMYDDMEEFDLILG